MNLNDIIEHYKNGNVSIQKHPFFDLYILNYTKKTSEKAIWDEITLESRGLIFNKKGDIISRPFRKFFEYEQITNKKIIPNEAPKNIYEKLDGSLGIMYWWNDRPYIATRGSFTSYQAIKATEILYQKYKNTLNLLNQEHTYLFEIIIPECRIVIDYKNIQDLYLIGVIDNKTQRGLNIEDFSYLKFPKPKIHSELNPMSIEQIANLNFKNKEGVVLFYNNGFRLKIKFPGYKKSYRYYTHTLKKLAFDIVFHNIKYNEKLNKTDVKYLKSIISKIEELKAQFPSKLTDNEKNNIWNTILSNQFLVDPLKIEQIFIKSV